MIIAVLGIDISKLKFDVTLSFEQESFQKTFTNDKKGFKTLLAWLKKKKVTKVHACMEATGNYGEQLALFLYKQHYIVSIVNPLRIKGYAQSKMVRNKTDQTDSALIASFCLEQNPEAWTPPPEEIRDLQSLLRRLETLQKMKQMEENRLESCQSDKEITASINRVIASLSKEIEKVKEAISKHIDSNPDLKQESELLQSVPGIGFQTAATLLAEIELGKFKSAKQAAAFAGVSPQRKQSGTSLKTSKISKIGNKRLRKALYMPAIVAKQFNPVVKAFCNRLKERGKPNMQIICAAMRKLIHIAFGVVKSGKPFDKNFAFPS